MSALSSVGTIIQGNAAKNAGEYNAALSDYNASQTENNGAIELQQQQRKAEQVIGNARAEMGASGVSSTQGSSLEVLKQSASQAALDSLNIQAKTAAKAYGYRATGSIQRYEGEEAQSSSRFTAAGQLLGGVAQLAAL